MYGLAGDDELVGFDGDDLLEGGHGADVLWGGYGFDYASYQGSRRGRVGLPVRAPPAPPTAATPRATPPQIEGVIGSAFNDGLGGNEQANVLRGEGGDDVLARLRGNDTAPRRRRQRWLNGGAGNDGSTAATATTLDGGSSGDKCSRAAPGSTGQLESAPRAWWPTSRRHRRRRRARPAARHREPRGLVSRRPARRRRRGQPAGREPRRGHAGRAGRRRSLRLPSRTTARPRRRTSSSTSDGRRATGSTFPASTRATKGAATGVPIHRPEGVLGRRPGPLLQGRRRHGGRGQPDDATAGAEMRIEIDPLVNLQATDFVL